MGLKRPMISCVVVGAFLMGITAGCGVGGGSGDVPPRASDFAVGSTVPGWLLTPSSPERDEVLASSVHDGTQWSVVLSRGVPSVPRDRKFGIAVADNGIHHVGAPSVDLTFDPMAQPGPNRVVGRRRPLGSIQADGVLSPGEWPLQNFTSLSLGLQNDLPVSYQPPLPAAVSLGVAVAYDEEFFYMAFQWADPSGTLSDQKDQLLWDGSAFVRRPHRGNDVNGDGILGPGEVVNFAAPAEDEDRLMIFWPEVDRQGAYAAQGAGCAASCHTNTAADPTGFSAVHAHLDREDRTDVWVWRAARTGPALHADDLHLRVAAPIPGVGIGSGLLEDGGISAFVSQDPGAPGWMFAGPPGGLVPLVTAAIDPAALALPLGGTPVVLANGAPFSPTNFNGTGQGPSPWSGGPGFRNDYVPGFALQLPTGSRGDVAAVASYAAGVWTLEMVRRRLPLDGSGAGRLDDVFFDEDADLTDGIGVTGRSFSLEVVDGSSGSARYIGPLVLTADPNSGDPGAVYVHSYGGAFSPTGFDDFTDPRETRPTPDQGFDPQLVLKAGTDGAGRVHVAARWSDGTVDRSKDRWLWNGFTWEQGGQQDSLRVLWNLGVEASTFGAMGCATFCHASGPGGELQFAGRTPGERADVWHWEAGRTAPRGVADDLHLDHQLVDLVAGGAAFAALHGDGDLSPFFDNLNPTGGHPRWMSPSDPNSNAEFLTRSVAGEPEAVDFQDVAAGLPSTPTGGGTVSFLDDVRPIFLQFCIECHPPFRGLDLSSVASILEGSVGGPVVVPGNPAASTLIQRMEGTVTPRMPLGQGPLSPETIAIVAAWIAQGVQNN